MTPKEKATDMVRKNFEILAKFSGYKSLKINGEKAFYTIENYAKQSSIIGVDSILNLDIGEPIDREYWQEVKQEIEKL